MAEDVKPVASALVLPPGTLPPQPSLGDKFELLVKAVTEDEIPESLIAYPDGFKKWHQAADLVELIGKISGTLRGRYGISAFAIVSTPGALEAGTIVLEDVKYGQQS